METFRNVLKSIKHWVRPLGDSVRGPQICGANIKEVTTAQPAGQDARSLYLVGVHLVAVFESKDASERDGDTVADHGQGEGVADHLTEQRGCWEDWGLETGVGGGGEGERERERGRGRERESEFSRHALKHVYVSPFL